MAAQQEYLSQYNQQLEVATYPLHEEAQLPQINFTSPEVETQPATRELMNTDEVTYAKIFDREKKAWELVDKLITPDYIMASSSEGHFFHPFVRDTNKIYFMAASMLQRHPQNEKVQNLYSKSASAVINLWKFQNEAGQLPHEVFPEGQIDKNHPMVKGGFFKEHMIDNKIYYISYDSVDGTALTLMATAKILQEEKKRSDAEDRIHYYPMYEQILKPYMDKATDFILKNSSNQKHDGLTTYFHDETKGKLEGLYTMTWEDSQFSEDMRLRDYQDSIDEAKGDVPLREHNDTIDEDDSPEKSLARRQKEMYQEMYAQGAFPPDMIPKQTHIVTAEVQAYAYDALMMMQATFPDNEKNSVIAERANHIKDTFNETFVYEEEGQEKLAKSIWYEDGKDPRMNKTTAANQALVLWASHNGESIIDMEKHPTIVSSIIKTITSPEDEGGLLNPQLGVAQRAKENSPIRGDGYHVDSALQIYWPLITQMACDGLLRAGYDKPTIDTMLYTIINVSVQKDSFPEQVNEKFKRFNEGNPINQSCKDQTWTLVAYLYALAIMGSHQDNESINPTPKNS